VDMTHIFSPFAFAWQSWSDFLGLDRTNYEPFGVGFSLHLWCPAGISKAVKLELQTVWAPSRMPWDFDIGFGFL